LQDRIEGLGFASYQQNSNISLASKERMLFLDSYSLDPFDEFINQNLWNRVIVIADDSTPKYPCFLSIHVGESIQSKPKNAKRYISGLQYIPLRKSITKTNDLRNKGDGIDSILVFGGGTDTNNFALALAECMAEIPGFRKVVFISAMAGEIEKLDKRFKVLPFGNGLDELMDSSDLILTTASTASFEVIAKGKPLGVVCAVDNQLHNYNNLTTLGLAQGIGIKVEGKNWDIDLTKLIEILQSHSIRNEMIKRTRDLVDLRGTSRIIDAALSP
jgi:spore coat polysaccharide biosynthesis predicted glycosyltransferase SpsG